MKNTVKYILLLFPLFVHAQDKLTLSSLKENRQYHFKATMRVSFTLKDDEKEFNDLWIDGSSDSSLFVSDGDGMKREILFRKLSTLQFDGSMKEGGYVLMGIGILFIGGSATTATDDSLGTFDQGIFAGMITTGAGCLAIGAFCAHHSRMKYRDFNMEEWVLTRKNEGSLHGIARKKYVKGLEYIER